MADTIRPASMPRSFLADAPAQAVNIGLSLMSRRSNAIADFWRSCAEIRQPTEFMAVQLHYWSQMVDDYQEALAEGLTQLSPGAHAMTTEPPPAARSA